MYCTRCARYPFCEKIEKPTGSCNDFIRKELETFIDKKVLHKKE